MNTRRDDANGSGSLMRLPQTPREWLAVAAIAAALLAAGAGLSALFLDSRDAAESAAGRMPADRAQTPPAAAPSPAAPAAITLTPEAIARAGIVVQTVTTQSIGRELRVPGTIEPNTERTTQVTSLVAGRVQSVNARLGDRVAAGQTLATIFSPELAAAQTQYLSQRAMLQAERQKLDRTVRLVEIGAASRQELEQIRAEHQALATEVESARENLRLLGLSNARINALSNASQVSSTVAVPAPVAGEITERIANPGLVVDTTTKLFTVTDLSTVWISAAVAERDLAAVRIGSTAIVNIPAFANEAVPGRVTYIAPAIDPTTRTVAVRVETRNPARRLKLGMFVNLKLGDVVSGTAVVIPRSSVQTIGERTVVYVAAANQPGTFVERDVSVGERSGDDVQIRSGLRAGEQVVVAGSFALRAERERTGGAMTAAPAALAPPAGGQTSTSGLARAFEHYEMARAALSDDRLPTSGAQELTAALKELGAPAAIQQAATVVGAAKTIAEARDAFGRVSEWLVPEFQKARVPGVQAFMCPMFKRPWAQRGSMANPYYGTAMSTCGSPL